MHLYITVFHYLVRKYCTVLTSVHSNDNLYRYCTLHYSGTLCHYYVNTVQYITYSVNTVQSVDSNDILYIVRKYCTVLTSVDSNDMLYRYCTVHYSRTLCHYYVNTVQYITYSVNTVQYVTVVITYYVNTVQY